MFQLPLIQHWMWPTLQNCFSFHLMLLPRRSGRCGKNHSVPVKVLLNDPEAPAEAWRQAASDGEERTVWFFFNFFWPLLLIFQVVLCYKSHCLSTTASLLHLHPDVNSPVKNKTPGQATLTRSVVQTVLRGDACTLPPGGATANCSAWTTPPLVCLHHLKEK